MKRILLVGILVFTLAIGTFAVYADSPDLNEFGREDGYMGRGDGHMNGNEFNRRIDLTEEERGEWFNKMQGEKKEYREERIKNDLKDGIITEQQATDWREHFTVMNKFHEQNGFVGGIINGERSGRGSGHGTGMMGGCGF